MEKTDEMKGEGKGLKNEDNGRNKIEKNLSFPPNIHRVVTMIEYLSLSGSGVTFGQLQRGSEETASQNFSGFSLLPTYPPSFSQFIPNNT